MKIEEHVEVAAWADLAEAAEAVELERFSGAAVLYTPGEPGILFNRAFGLDEVSIAQTSRVLDCFVSAGVHRFFVHLWPEAAASVGARLEARDVVPYARAWLKLGRDRAPVRDAATSLAIRAATPADGAAFGAILAAGFDFGAVGASAMTTLIGRPRWYTFVATDGPKVVAAAGLFVDGDAGYLPFAATLPDARKRGAQAALMAERLRVAQDLGCRKVFTETGEAADGDPNHSFKNMLRAGFRVTGTRSNYAPRGMRWVDEDGDRRPGGRP